jgi:hypothetical protein
MRIWTGSDWPFGIAPSGGIAVEWLGSVGYPTHYALVGGTLSDRSVVRIAESSKPFDGSLEGSGTVIQGLDSWSATGIDMATELVSTPLAINAAASSVGSSPNAVCFATVFVARLLNTPELLEADDDSLWAAWGESIRRCMKLSEKRGARAQP